MIWDDSDNPPGNIRLWERLGTTDVYTKGPDDLAVGYRNIFQCEYDISSDSLPRSIMDLKCMYQSNPQIVSPIFINGTHSEICIQNQVYEGSTIPIIKSRRCMRAYQWHSL